MTSFSKNLPLLLFDLDGVLLSEARYLDAAALTVAQLAPVRLDPKGQDQVAACHALADMECLRERWFPDEVIACLRRRAMNSNWDKAYACLLALYTPLDQDVHPLGERLLAVLEEGRGTGPGYLADLCRRAHGAPSFVDVQSMFQRFFLGDRRLCGGWLRRGLVAHETTLCAADLTRDALTRLRAGGFTLGIGTGRPRTEAQRPLSAAGLWSQFEPSRIVTYDEVHEEECKRQLKAGTLAKPHPFTYLTGAQGVCAEHVCVIGDSPADALAAQAAGFAFIAIGETGLLPESLPRVKVCLPDVLALPDYLL